MTTTGIILLVVAIIVIAVLAWYLVRERRSKGLRSRFGPEYDFAMREFGNRPKAEDALAAQRVIEAAIASWDSGKVVEL